jgi:hypothetical protein
VNPPAEMTTINQVIIV